HRHRLSVEDAEEVRSITYVRLIDNDYAIIRRFQGRSRFRTYLATVILRILLDYRNKKWGKWRPSNTARELGTVAVQLERLLYHDDFTFRESAQILRNRGIEASDDHLGGMAHQIPQRARRIEEPIDVTFQLSSGDCADDRLWRSERDRILA
ncbi:MAG: hypothetical protein MI919_24910, partial [Holophagales bacterium]|nr:hypothetical protein [Holophagales bacterium]